MNHRRSIPILWLLVLFFSVSAVKAMAADMPAEDAPAEVYTIEKSIQEALENNWSLKAKTEKIDQAVQVKNQARADFLPKFSTSYSYTRLQDVQTSKPVVLGPGLTLNPVPQNSRDNYEWRGTVTQPLFKGFALLSAYELAKLGIDQSELDVDLAKLDLALQVKEAYFNIIFADKAVEVAQKEVESLTSNVEVARNFYNVGMIPVNDLLKSEVALANATQALVKAETGAKYARSAFNTVLSRDVNLPVQVEDVLTYQPETGGFDEYLVTALEHRPEIRIIDVNLLQVDQQIRLARSKFYPEVGLNYDYIKEGDSPGVSGSDFHEANRWQASAVLSWTFFEWGKTRSAVLEQEGVKRELTQVRASLEDQVSLELKRAILELEVTEKNVPTTEKAVEQGEENLRVSEERYKAQVTTMTEVLEAQALLTSARVNYYNALIDHNLAKARLLRSVGQY